MVRCVIDCGRLPLDRLCFFNFNFLREGGKYASICLEEILDSDRTAKVDGSFPSRFLMGIYSFLKLSGRRETICSIYSPANLRLMRECGKDVNCWSNFFPKEVSERRR